MLLFCQKVIIFCHFWGSKKELSRHWLWMANRPSLPDTFCQKLGICFARKKHTKKCWSSLPLGQMKNRWWFSRKKVRKSWLFWRKRKREGIAYQTKLVKSATTYVGHMREKCSEKLSKQLKNTRKKKATSTKRKLLKPVEKFTYVGHPLKSAT